VTEGRGSAVLGSRRNAQLAEGVVRIAGGLPESVMLGAGFAALTVEKA